jgi:mannose-6-phosphate isomerase-like protein (cupin superfamily)
MEDQTFFAPHKLALSILMVGERMVRHQAGNYTWEGVDVLPYKETGTHFKSITRQTLFHGEGDLPVEFRYFEVQAGGYSTLERHHHQHAVMIIRGSGHVLVGDKVTQICLHDLVHIPPMTWHQFHADRGEKLGFLCVVATDRDRPQRPEGELPEELSSDPTIANFVRI